METVPATNLPLEHASIAFFIAGIPAPGGSKKAFPLWRKDAAGVKQFVRSIIVDDAGQRNKDWKSNVGWTGKEAMIRSGFAPFQGPLEVSFHFVMPRLKSHFSTTKKHGTLPRPDRPLFHTVKPDTTKLIRSTEDGLKGICWLDDSQIAVQHASKTYGNVPGCKVTIKVPFA